MLTKLFRTLKSQGDAYLYDGNKTVSVQDVSATRTGARPYTYAVVIKFVDDNSDVIAQASAIADSDDQLRILMEINKVNVDDSRWM